MQYFTQSEDYNNTAYNTKFGVYSEGCGLNNVMMSWGHDDYMYLVLVPILSKLSKYFIFDSWILLAIVETKNLTFVSRFVGG